MTGFCEGGGWCWIWLLRSGPWRESCEYVGCIGARVDGTFKSRIASRDEHRKIPDNVLLAASDKEMGVPCSKLTLLPCFGLPLLHH